MSDWLATIIELSLIGFKTLATATASEVIAFRETNPPPQQVLEYQISEASQERLRRLLALNEAGLVSKAKQAGLDELEQIEHVIVMLKARLSQAN